MGCTLEREGEWSGREKVLSLEGAELPARWGLSPDSNRSEKKARRALA